MAHPHLTGSSPGSHSPMKFHSHLLLAPKVPSVSTFQHRRLTAHQNCSEFPGKPSLHLNCPLQETTLLARCPVKLKVQLADNLHLRYLWVYRWGQWPRGAALYRYPDQACTVIGKMVGGQALPSQLVAALRYIREIRRPKCT